MSRGIRGAAALPPPPRSTLLWAVAALGGLLSILLLFPGQYPFDSAYQLWQARTGAYNNLSPVTMILTWSMLLETGAGPASLFLLNLVMAWCGWALCADALRLPVGWKIGMLLIAGATPLELVEMAHLLSDAHLAAVLLLATGLLADKAVRGGNVKGWIALGLLVYAGTIRHNALVAILPFGMLLACDSHTPSRGRLRRVVFAVVGLVVASAILGVLLDRAFVVERKTAWTALAMWDLAAISVDSRKLLLPDFAHGPGLSVAELIETNAFDPVSNVSLYTRSRSGIRAGVLSPFSWEQKRQLLQHWARAVRDYPLSYLHHRLRTFGLLVGIPSGSFTAVAYLQDRQRYRDAPPLPEPLAAELQVRFYRWMAQQHNAWWMRALPSLALLAVAFIAGWRRRDDPLVRVGWIASTSAILYALTFLWLAPGAELRYLTWILTIAPIALLMAMSGHSRGWRA